MGYSGDVQTLNRNETNLQRAANDGFEFLKTATSFARGKSPEVLTTPAPAPMPEPRPLETITRKLAPVGSGPSIISLKVEMTGSITSPDEVHIYGTIEGNVRASSLTICEGGSVRGDVIAETVLVHGTLEGRIFAQKTQLFAGATVRGDIIHSSLGVDVDAFFEGASKRSQNPIAEASLMTSPARA